MTTKSSIAVVDDDSNLRASLKTLLESADYRVTDYESAAEFLRADSASFNCLVTDVQMPEMDGLKLQEEIVRRGTGLPVIIMTGHGDVPLAVRAMKAGAVEFIEKPFDNTSLLESVRNALFIGERIHSRAVQTKMAQDMLARLTPREKEVFDQLVAGKPNKIAAYILGMSPRTVEIHRANIMGKMKTRSLSDLVRTAIAAEEGSEQNSE